MDRGVHLDVFSEVAGVKSGLRVRETARVVDFHTRVGVHAPTITVQTLFTFIATPHIALWIH